jgi:hypothetical protein
MGTAGSMITALWVLAQPIAPTQVTQPATPLTTAAAAPSQCDARPFARLKGRAIGEVLAVRLPPGTLVQHVNDGPAAPSNLAERRLTIEIGRNTRVRRVYCG